MDGATQPVLAVLQTPPGVVTGAASAPSSAGGPDGFAAILGATELTGLIVGQPTASAPSSADPGRVVQRQAASGKVLPPAALPGQPEGLDCDVGGLSPGTDWALPVVAEPTEVRSGDVVEERADLVALMTMLPSSAPSGPPPQLPAVPSSPAAVEPAAHAASGGDAPSLPLAASVRGVLAAITAGNVTATGAGAPPPDPVPMAGLDAVTTVPVPVAKSTAVLGTLRQLIPGGGSLTDAARPAAPSTPVEPVPPGGSAMPIGTLEIGPAGAAAVDAVADGLDEAATKGKLPTELLAGSVATPDVAETGTAVSGRAAAPEPAAPRASALATDAVAVPVGERGWERAFGERVVWLVSRQIQAAEIKLNPPHLGPVEVRLSLTGQDATVNFTVAHGATRDAIEQAIPRLRELFADQQLQIVNVDVGQRHGASQAFPGDRHGSAGDARPRVDPATGATEPIPGAQVRRTGLLGLVDEYV